MTTSRSSRLTVLWWRDIVKNKLREFPSCLIIIQFPCGFDDWWFLSESTHTKGDPSLERCVASVNPKRLKDQQGPRLVTEGSRQSANTSSAGVFLSELRLCLFFCTGIAKLKSWKLNTSDRPPCHLNPIKISFSPIMHPSFQIQQTPYLLKIDVYIHV